VFNTRRRQPKMEELYEKQAQQEDNLRKLADNGNTENQEENEWIGEP